MKEFIENLIGRLEEKENEAVFNAPNVIDISNTEYQKWMMKSYGFREAIEIVNELAEEYNESETGFISRTKVLQFIEDIEYNKDIPKNYGTLLDIMRYIRKMPAISNNNDWIPCSERLPEKYGEYLCCDKYGEYIIGYPTARVSSDDYYVETEHEIMNNCIAWQPLPKPYRPEGE